MSKFIEEPKSCMSCKYSVIEAVSGTIPNTPICYCNGWNHRTTICDPKHFSCNNYDNGKNKVL